MNDEHFERLMKDAAETYNRPPKAPLDEMWASIESETFGTRLPVKRHRGLVANPWLRMAAGLVLGVAIGRGSMMLQKPTPTTAVPQKTVASAQDAADPYQ